MIYLFGGPPRCGKTTLAELWANQRKIPYFSIDHITSAIIPYLVAEDVRLTLPLRIAIQDAGGSNDVFYAKWSPQQIVQMYITQAETLWPGLKSFIEYGLRDEHDLILEGWQILPRFVDAIRTNENTAQLKATFLYKRGIESLVTGLKANSAGADWVNRHTSAPDTYTAIAEMIGEFGRIIEADARKFGLDCVNTESHFAQTIANIVGTLH